MSMFASSELSGFYGCVDSWMTAWCLTDGASLWIAQIDFPRYEVGARGVFWVEGTAAPDSATDYAYVRFAIPAGAPGTFGLWPELAADVDPSLLGRDACAIVMVQNPLPKMRIVFECSAPGTPTPSDIRNDEEFWARFHVFFSLRG